MTLRRAWPLLALGIVAFAAWTPARSGIVIYRCTDLYGRLTVQNDVPCPKGTREQKQVVDPPPPMPAYQPIARPDPAPQPPPPAPPLVAATPEATVAPSPPPPLHQCERPDGERYFSEEGEPAPRCVALQVVGLDGGARTAAGAACELVRDSCTPVPDAATCDAWRRYVRDAETAWRFGRKELAEQHQAAFERLQRIVAGSSCAQAAGAQRDAGT